MRGDRKRKHYYQTKLAQRLWALLFCALSALPSAHAQQQGTAAPSSYGDSYAKNVQATTNGTTQLQHQKDNTSNENSAGDQSHSMGSMLQMMSMAMIAAGIALNASSIPCHCAGIPLIASGIFFGQGAAGAHGAGNEMQRTAGVSVDYGNHLDSLNQNLGKGITDVKGSSFSATGLNNEFSNNSLGANSEGNAFRAATDSLSDAQLNSGKLGEALSELEKNYGIDRREFAQAVASGKGVSELLAKHGATFGKSADSFLDEVDKEKVNPEELKEKLANGEFDEYSEGAKLRGILAGASQAGEAAGVDAQKNKTYDQILAELFGKNGDSGTSKNALAAALSEAAKKEEAGKQLTDAQVRGLASNKDYYVSSDLVKKGLYEEQSIFEQVKTRYRAQMPNMLSTDYFMRMTLDPQTKKRAQP